MKKFLKIIIFFFIILLTTILLYLYGLPRLISSGDFISRIEKAFKDKLNADLIINTPKLTTSIKPEISFTVDLLSLTKDGELLLNLQNFDTKINFYKIFKRKITLEKLGAEEIYFDGDKIKKLKIETKKKKDEKPFFSFDCYNTLFYIKRLAVLQSTKRNVFIKLLAHDLEISDSREPKMVHFNVFLDLYYNNEHLNLIFKDNNKVYFKNRKLNVEDFNLDINKSKVKINYIMDEKGHFDLSLNADKFEIENVRRFLNTDLFVANGHEFVSYFKDFNGNFNFKLNATEKDVNGFLKINKISAKLIPVANLPLTLTKGLITINSKDIMIKDFEGYYGSNIKNNLKMSGFIKDYQKTANTEIEAKGIIKDEFGRYLTKISGVKINILNNAYSKFKISFANNTKMDILGNIMVPKGSDVLLENTSISSDKYTREFNINMDLLKETLLINNIDYHISDKNSDTSKPLITLNGKVNITNGYVNEMGFDIPEPLPSEFFNALVNQKIFRRGTIDGKMRFVNGNYPHLEGRMNLKDTFIVGQGIIVKNMSLKSENNLLKIISEGYIRRAKYNLNADILNNMTFPVIVKGINLTFDNIDIEKVIQSFAPRPQRPAGTNSASNRPRIELAKSNISSEYFEVETKTQKTETSSEDIPQLNFAPNLIEIENGQISVKKGTFKTMTFDNLNADLTLSKQGILNIKSNKFNLTEGTSDIKVYCDFLKQKYFVRLGALNVNIDAVASSILNLNNEISGHAKALIELNTDETLKMNGKIKFEVNDGSIAKLGLVQYILNMAMIFRNPLATLNPSSIYDIVNIPEGSFKKINGTLDIEKNIIEKMMIKSSSPNLSSFIIGRINLEDMDASLRIYTKFSASKKGIFGILRGISLSALSQRASLIVKGNLESYYSTELPFLPKLDSGEETAKIFLMKFDGDLQSANFISSLKKIK